MKYTGATTYGESAETTALALCGRLGLPHVATLEETGHKEATDEHNSFIYAGSTSASLSTIQMAKL
jgi:hypothetical protein